MLSTNISFLSKGPNLMFSKFISYVGGLHSKVFYSFERPKKNVSVLYFQTHVLRVIFY